MEKKHVIIIEELNWKKTLIKKIRTKIKTQKTMTKINKENNRVFFLTIKIKKKGGNNHQ